MAILDQFGLPKTPLPDRKLKCDHERHIPKVPDDETLNEMSVADIRKKYPRFEGTCQDCGARMILYGSVMHYILGDW